MTKALKDIFPNTDELLQLEPEDIATFLLDHLCRLEQNRRELNRFNFILEVMQQPDFGDNRNKVAKAITEAWMWLEKEGMLAPKPGDPDGHWMFVTRRGYNLRKKADLEAYKKSYFLQKTSLDENLARKAYPLFLRGDYDTAVFQSYKEVEIRVRKKTSLPNTSYGLDLIKEAFHPDKGILTDKEAVMSERQAMYFLFAGGIGLFKNPSSHREVNYNDPSEAAELILFANYLLRLIDRIKEKMGQTNEGKE